MAPRRPGLGELGRRSATATAVLFPPVASSATRMGLVVACDDQGLAAWPDADVQPILRHIDSNKHIHLPSLHMRARDAAPATVRDVRMDGWGSILANGLLNPRSARAPIRRRAVKLSNAARRTKDTRSHRASKDARLSTGYGDAAITATATAPAPRPRVRAAARLGDATGGGRQSFCWYAAPTTASADSSVPSSPRPHPVERRRRRRVSKDGSACTHDTP
jgi:hypothetical protein